MVNPFENTRQSPSKKERFWKVTKAILLTKFNTNILAFLIVILLTIAGFHVILRANSITGNVILEHNLSFPASTCPACIQQECKQDCTLCPSKINVEEVQAIKIRCSDGSLIDEDKECSLNFPEVDEKASGTVSGITLAIDEIQYEKSEGDTGFVTAIEYAIINKADYPIVPRIEIKVYDEWSSRTHSSEPNKNLKIGTVVNPNSYIKRKDAARIFFKGAKQKVRLLLIDTLPEKDEEIVAVVKEIELN